MSVSFDAMIGQSDRFCRSGFTLASVNGCPAVVLMALSKIPQLFSFNSQTTKYRQHRLQQKARRGKNEKQSSIGLYRLTVRGYVYYLLTVHLYVYV